MAEAANKLQKKAEQAAPFLCIALIITVWQILCASGAVPGYMLPSPGAVIRAFCSDFPLLMQHCRTTLYEAALGLLFSIILAFVTSFLMDRFLILNKAIAPLLVMTQTVPAVAIAPLLILWLGYGSAPKVTLIVITCYFPLTVNLLAGFASADTDAVNLLRAMGASRMQIFIHLKLPSSLGHFFSGLKVAVSYSVVGAVISEWLGGMSGLGVYMIRVKKSYSFDKMFAVIFLISAVSLALMKIVSLLEKEFVKK